MTKRSRLLEKYLREKLGWTTGADEEVVCLKCRMTTDTLVPLVKKKKFCAWCGSKLPKVREAKLHVLDELEAALRFSVDKT